MPTVSKQFKRLALISLLSLAALDIIITNLILLQGGGEWNPIMRPVIDKGIGMLLKMFVTFLIAVYLYYRSTDKKAFIIVNAVMALIVSYNIINLIIILIYQPYLN